MFDKESIVFFCPLCKMELENSKIKTRHQHDQRYHADYFTMQTGIKREEYLGKNYLK